LQAVSSSTSLIHERPFFICLIQALLRHKSKLSRATRDSIVSAWLEWLRMGGQDSIVSAAHECLIMLLNEWALLGNLLLPRDMFVKFCTDAVETVNVSVKDNHHMFHVLWKLIESHQTEPNVDASNLRFAPIVKQYERVLQVLPKTHAEHWKKSVGLLAEHNPVSSDDDSATKGIHLVENALS